MKTVGAAAAGSAAAAAAAAVMVVAAAAAAAAAGAALAAAAVVVVAAGAATASRAGKGAATFTKHYAKRAPAGKHSAGALRILVRAANLKGTAQTFFMMQSNAR